MTALNVFYNEPGLTQGMAWREGVPDDERDERHVHSSRTSKITFQLLSKVL